MQYNSTTGRGRYNFDIPELECGQIKFEIFFGVKKKKSVEIASDLRSIEVGCTINNSFATNIMAL